MAQFAKGQIVTGKGSRAANIRYRVETRHRTGDYTVRALFFIDEQTGEDIPGYLGYSYRVSADALAPLPAKLAGA